MAGIGGMGTGSFRDRANAAVRRGARPTALMVAEVFLMLIVGIYMTKMAMLAVGLHEGIGMHRTSLVVYIVEAAMLILTCDSLLVVSSRNPRAWKKMVRASTLLIVFNLIYWLGLSHSTAASFAVINPLLITPMAIFIILVMYWSPVRRYYTPIMEEERTLWQWFKYSWFSPLYTSESYRIMYEEER